jgi:uncharacterized protein (DUF1778 family)
MAPAVEKRSRKNGRLEARVTPEMKAMFQEAADLEGLSLTDFLIRSVREAAQRTFRERESMELSRRDQALFVQALLDPPMPNARLQKAAQRYTQMFG